MSLWLEKQDDDDEEAEEEDESLFSLPFLICLHNYYEEEAILQKKFSLKKGKICLNSLTLHFFNVDLNNACRYTRISIC